MVGYNIIAMVALLISGVSVVMFIDPNLITNHWWHWIRGKF